MLFIPAAELKKRFVTEGAFYSLEVQGQEYPCRGVARIFRKDAEAEQADALVVMMNPGSCLPLDAEYVYPPAGDLFDIPMVRAKEDSTQYQLMRLMERMQWDLIYLINLSDLASGNSDEFVRTRKKVLDMGCSEHSIFSDSRNDDIHTLLMGSDRVILAWGKREEIKDDALVAHAFLSKLTRLDGLCCGQPFYRHPNPMLKWKCEEWLADMCHALDEESESQVFV